MVLNDVLANATKKLNDGKNLTFQYTINDIPYTVHFLFDNKITNANLPSILLFPSHIDFNNQIVMEVNNNETDNKNELLKQGIETAYKLATITSTNPAPILIPILPSFEKGPYFQQLSRECFDLEQSNVNYRIDEQVIQVLNNAKSIIEKHTNIKPDDKIFITGYSSSGVFAQRFCLLHPDVIETACIGGASGSIPLPSENLNYPLGIGDFKEITGHSFNIDEYSKIKFRYYVGELETKNKSSKRFDEDGNYAPMHDMSYFDKSVPSSVGIKQREIFGRNMFERANKIKALLNEMGIDMEHIIIPGRTHNNNSGIGVNELGDNYIRYIYDESSELSKSFSEKQRL